MTTVAQYPPSSPSQSRNSFLSASENPRNSYISTSAASYQTALGDPSASTAHVPSISSSPSSSPGLNPIHLLAASQLNGDRSAPVHVHRVTQDTVYLGTEGTDPSLASRVGQSIVGAIDPSGHKFDASAALGLLPGGPQIVPVDPSSKNHITLSNGFYPPPSPPSSESPTEQGTPILNQPFSDEPVDVTPNGVIYDDATQLTPRKPSRARGNVAPPSPTSPVRMSLPPRPSTTGDPRKPRGSDNSSVNSATTSNSSFAYPRVTRDAATEVTVPSTGITNSYADSMHTIQQQTPIKTSFESTSAPEYRPSYLERADAAKPFAPAASFASSVETQAASALDTKGVFGPAESVLLHPSSAASSISGPSRDRPIRRNTTGSTFQPGHRATRSNGGVGPLNASDDMSALGHPLDTDILKEAEQIRRERHSKRAKAQAEAEAALTAPSTAPNGRLGGATARKVDDNDNQVLVGNLIGEDHVNYVLMYNMLTGIRIGVSRCQAKVKRPLTAEDYTARHKFSFDIVGNELTPSAKYDFKFKDYAPWVFRELREEHFHIDPADYLLSLTSKYILSELGSPGKSGSFFYFSRDYRFIIKTIHHNEHKFLRKILPIYHNHVKTNPHTLLSRFYGLHRVKLPHGRKIHFVIMNNLFPPHRDIHETYDLKGSTVGREYPEEKAATNPRAVLKDLNWINRGRQLELGPEKRALLAEQLRRDSELLKQLNVMDYSLLVGIHNMQRGNRDNLRRNTLKVFQPDIHPMRRRRPSQSGKADQAEAKAMRRAMRQSDPQALGAETTVLPEVDSADRKHFIFYQDEGGYRATDDANYPMDTIYYLGIIDICTPYTTFKKVEHLWKGLSADRHKISPVPATEYASRFFSFLTSVIRGGGGAERFKAE